MREKYQAHDWQNQEIISEQNLDRIENGIQALDEDIGRVPFPEGSGYESVTDAISKMNAIVRSADIEQLKNSMNIYINEEIEKINSNVNQKINDFNTTANEAIETAQTAATNAEGAAKRITDNLIKTIYGENATEPYNGDSASLKEWINSQLASLTNDIQNTISPNITALQEVDQRIEKALGTTYYNVTNSSWDLGADVKSVDTRISEIYDAIFGESSTGSSKTIVEQIADLNTAIFGDSTGTTQASSLIDKIEAALGRKLEYTNEDNPDEIESASILSTLRNILNTLGMAGGQSSGEQQSTLIDDVNMALNLLYGYTIEEVHEDPEDDESPIIKKINRKTAPNLLEYAINNSYPTLYKDFYNITASYTEVDDETQESQTITETKSAKDWIIDVYSTINNVSGTNNYILELLDGYSDIETKAENSYEAADTADFGDDTYLILKRNREAGIAEKIEDFSETGEYQGSTYIRLPKGGGGGGTTYDLQAKFVDVVYPTNTSLVVGDNSNISFKWQVLDEDGNQTSLDGNLVIRLNNSTVYTRTISSNTQTSYTFNLGEYIKNSGKNVFVITVSNASVASKNLYVTITSYIASLTDNFNPDIIQTSSSIEYGYTASIGSAAITKVLHIQIDDMPELVLSNNETRVEQQNTITFPTPSTGEHLLTIWFTAAISSDTTISSQKKTYGILCGTTNTTRITSNFVNGTEVERYSNLIINYKVYTPNQSTTPVTVYINDSTSGINLGNIGPNYTTWSYPVTQPAGQLTIRIEANGQSKVLTAVITDKNEYDLSMVESGLKVFFTANQRTNTESKPNIWKNNINGENIPDIAASMSNFLFYQNVDGWLQDADGGYFLRLRNQNKVVIPFSIFNNCTISEETNEIEYSNNLAQTGMTFEIDFRTQDVADYNTNIIACYEGDTVENSTKNILLTPQSALINNVKTLITQYKEEEKITLAFVINPVPGNSSREADNSDGLLYIYVNGILSAATPYHRENSAAPSLGFLNPENAKIELGSTECTLDLYSIRFYERPLTYKEIIKNWIYNTSNFNTKIQRYQRNNYDALSINSFITNSPTTPYMIITGKGPLDDVRNENGEVITAAYMPQQKGSDYKKTADIIYVDPVHPEYSFNATSFDAATFTGKAEVQVQGTSSQAYYRKNYKIKLASFTQNGILHIKKPSTDDYKTTIDEETGATVVTEELKDGITKEGYKLRENSYPEFTFCIKADVASSESTNNTGLTQIYDEAIRNFSITPPQHDDPRIRQGVEGYPMVCWYRNANTGEEILLGKYNFNNDKGTEKVYGLKTGLSVDKSYKVDEFEKENGIYDESWEVKNNDANSLVQFEVAGTTQEERDATWLGYTYDTTGNIKLSSDGNPVLGWQNSFESRFPDQDDEGIALINPNEEVTIQTEDGEKIITKSSENDINYLKKRLAGLREMVEWVDRTVVWADASKTSITTESATAFKSNFEKYFNLNAMLFFYLFTELFLMVDNRAKNMFWTRYQVREGIRPKTADYDEPTNLLAPDNNNYYGWFTYPYDFDTAIGINNQGKNVYDYHWESLDVTGADGSAIFGGQYSKLWVAFRQAYSTEIASFYPRMTSYIKYTDVEQLFEQNQSIWSETIVNEDMRVKYIDWATDIGYDMLLGLKDMQRKWWLYNRFKYFNSKFAIDRGTDNINIRIHKNYAQIPVEVYADSYVSVNVGANGAPTTIRVLRGETNKVVEVGTPGATGTDSSGIETYISPASSLKTVRNLSTFEISSIDVSKAIRLQSLQIGTPNASNANTRLRNINVTPQSGYSSLLRYIDLRNCVKCGILTDQSGNEITTEPTLNVSGCLFLNTIYLAGTPLHKIDLPNGGVLKTIQYPTTIKEIVIQNQPFLNNLIIGPYLPLDEITDTNYENEFNGINNYENITTLILNNINEAINVPEIVMNGNNITTCSLSNLTFRMSGVEFKAFFDRLVEINATISSCTLYLSDNLPEGFTVNNITEKFDIKVYGVGGKEYFNVRFYNLSNDLILTQSVLEGEGLIGPTTQTYFTDDYLNEYNGLTQENMSLHETRIGFGGWPDVLTNIHSDLDVRPKTVDQYRMAYHYLNENQEMTIYYRYYTPNDIDNPITGISTPTFVKDYYTYAVKYWTSDSDTPSTYPDYDNRAYVGDTVIKQAEAEDWYAVYKHDEAALYNISLYNTDINGEKSGEPLLIFQRSVVGTNHLIYQTDFNNYLPEGSQEAHIEGVESDELENYAYLDLQPYIPSNGLQVTGDMDILIKYYKKDDDFTNYFLNKLERCDLGNVTDSLPQGAFFHSSNLIKLTTSANEIGSYCFANYNDEKKRYFIFNAENIHFSERCFAYINNCIIIFNGTGQINIDDYNFYQVRNCKIIIPNSDLPIITNPDATQSFYNFLNDGNQIYVTPSAKEKYNADNTNVPSYLAREANEKIVAINEANRSTIEALIEEANEA